MTWQPRTVMIIIMETNHLYGESAETLEQIKNEILSLERALSEKRKLMKNKISFFIDGLNLSLTEKKPKQEHHPLKSEPHLRERIFDVLDQSRKRSFRARDIWTLLGERDNLPSISSELIKLFKQGKIDKPSIGRYQAKG